MRLFRWGECSSAAATSNAGHAGSRLRGAMSTSRVQIGAARNNTKMSLEISACVDPISVPSGDVTTVSLPKDIASSTETADGVVTTSAGRVVSAIASSESGYSRMEFLVLISGKL